MYSSSISATSIISLPYLHLCNPMLHLHLLTFISSVPKLLEVHEVLCALEKKVETPHNSRIRPLSGADVSHTQFQQKIEDVSALECKLAV